VFDSCFSTQSYDLCPSKFFALLHIILLHGPFNVDSFINIFISISPFCSSYLYIHKLIYSCIIMCVWIRQKVKTTHWVQSVFNDSVIIWQCFFFFFLIFTFHVLISSCLVTWVYEMNIKTLKLCEGGILASVVCCLSSLSLPSHVAYAWPVFRWCFGKNPLHGHSYNIIWLFRRISIIFTYYTNNSFNGKLGKVYNMYTLY